ncbi:hypothetical protein AGMMS50293_11770 [Spirochaetia bacterium]|nr:hypothetical protein AGMMS50293_11770 [Spirochaetia bacterium]
MGESRLSVRVDERTKRKAEKVFQKLGLNLSAGISIYLNRVALQQAIPFPLSLQKTAKQAFLLENSAKEAVQQAVDEKELKGLPVALYDSALKRPYLKYPNGKKEYSLAD